MPSPTMHQYKLCYVRWNRAFFTTQDIKNQDGNKWDVSLDFPPYFYEETLQEKKFVEMPYMIRSIVFYDGNVDFFPDFLDFSQNAKGMNERGFPWLRTKVGDDYRFIFAGATLAQVIQELEKAGAKVYLQPHDYLEFVEAEKLENEQLNKLQEAQQELIQVETKKLTKKRGRPKKK